MLRFERKEYLVDIDSNDHVNISLVASQPFSTNTTVSIALKNDTTTCESTLKTILMYILDRFWLVLYIYYSS